MIAKAALEVAIIDTTTTTTDVAEMALVAWRKMVGRGLEMQLMALLHERFEWLLADVTIGLHLRNAIAEIDLAVGTDGDTPESTVALHSIGCMTLHEVVETSVGIYGLFNLHDTVEELAVLLVSVMCVTSLKDFLAQFEENRMMAL